jgi:hypothetical protein
MELARSHAGATSSFGGRSLPPGRATSLNTAWLGMIRSMLFISLAMGIVIKVWLPLGMTDSYKMGLLPSPKKEECRHHLLRFSLPT